MSRTIEEDIEIISKSMTDCMRAMSRAQMWEHFTEVAGVSIDKPAIAILGLLVEAGEQGLQLSAIAKMLGVEAPSITRKVQQLELQGLVERKSDKEDQRVYIVHATSRGIEVSEKVNKVRLQTLKSILSKWNAEDRSKLAYLFGRMCEDIIDYKDRVIAEKKPELLNIKRGNILR